MFKDYYSILEISEQATLNEIKAAFKKQSLKWHPDRNLGKDTTSIMQDINEAYLILKDEEARKKYDIELSRFKIYNNQANKHSDSNNKEKTEPNFESPKNEFTFEDEILKKWMENARRQAVDLARQSLEDVKGMIIVGTKEAAKDAGTYILFCLIIAGIALIFFFFKTK